MNEPFEGFWKRLKTFVENVEVNDPMSEEEKGMILYICEEQATAKYLVKPDVSGSFANKCRVCSKEIEKPAEWCDDCYPYKIVSK